MLKTHGHVSHCLPLVNKKLKVDCAIFCCGQLLEFARTSACVSRSGASDADHFFAECHSLSAKHAKETGHCDP